ncbi:MAG: ABC transporter transmembrane domain-containing protein, partial [bacterium]|nr:ABC transporter transmembrane domain-containing protein [bacterium]
MTLNPLKPFMPYLRVYPGPVILGLVMLLGVEAVQATIPMILKWAVDTAKAGLDAGGLFDATAGTLTGSTMGDLGMYAALMAGLGLVQWGMSFGTRWYIGRVSRLVERDIRSAYVRRLVTLPLAFFQGQRVGDLMARATNDVEAVQRFLYFAYRMFLTTILNFVLSLILMCTIDWQLAIYALAPMPIMAISTRWVSGKVHTGYRRVQEQFAAISTKVQENLSGIHVVKAYVQRPFEIERFGLINDEYVARNRHLINISSLFYPFTFLLSGVSMVVILWLGGLRVVEGSLSLGAFVAFNAYLVR